MIALIIFYIAIGLLTTLGYAIAFTTAYVKDDDPVEMAMALIVVGILSVGCGAIWPISMPAGIYVLKRMQ